MTHTDTKTDHAPLLAPGQTFGIVGTVEEAASDPQARAAGILKPMADSDFLTVDSPFTLNNEPKTPATRHPEHGEHSREILLNAGYSPAEVESLHKAGTIGGPYFIMPGMPRFFMGSIRMEF